MISRFLVLLRGVSDGAASCEPYLRISQGNGPASVSIHKQLKKITTSIYTNAQRNFV